MKSIQMIIIIDIIKLLVFGVAFPRNFPKKTFSFIIQILVWTIVASFDM